MQRDKMRQQDSNKIREIVKKVGDSGNLLLVACGDANNRRGTRSEFWQLVPFLKIRTIQGGREQCRATIFHSSFACHEIVVSL
ncbi:MAG: hypothetical protein DMG64_07235 [Acidobacteria bacterium]|nr:MAG: hypothetical protein DMG64_07235 [Acidobacteriota bacterium]PYY24538.1 MAG: hypothetical protein DMG62_02955 [Acidobacteriota bacterium]